MIERATDAEWANRVLNSPVVRPDVADEKDGPLNIEPIVANPLNVVLNGEHGVFVVIGYGGGIYEAHTAILPSGRGAWAVEFARAGFRYMFTTTDCVEVLTRVPKGHIAAKALTERVGFRHQFTTPAECLFRGSKVPCHIYTMTLQEWFTTASEMEAIGEQFHAWLQSKLGKMGAHEDDPAHNRVVGITIEMFRSGKARKAVVWYNRTAIASRHVKITLLSESPAQVQFDAGILTMRDGGIVLERAH